MKRFISVLLAAALLLCSLTACSSKDEAKLTSKELADVINANGNDMTKHNPAVALDSDDENLSNLLHGMNGTRPSLKPARFPSHS